MATDYGTDLSCTSALDPTFTVISGPRVLAEALLRSLTTPRGSLFYVPDYGWDVRELLLARADEGALARWRADVERECMKDERVDRARAGLLFTPATGALRITIDVVPSEGDPFTMVLAVSAVSVDLLEVR